MTYLFFSQRPLKGSVCFVLALFLGVVGCYPTPEETTTRGNLKIIADEAVGKMVDVQTKDFNRTWKEAQFTHETALTRKAVEMLLNKETEFIVISRPFKSDEDSVAKRLKIELVTRPMAMDAICFVTHPKNPVTKLTLEQAKGIFEGKIRNWNAIPGGKEMPIRLFVTSLNDGQRDNLVDSLLRGGAIDTSAYPCQSAAQVLDYVAQYEGAIGYTSTALAKPALAKNSTSPFRVISLSKNDSSEAFRPSQQHIYDRHYPLWYFVHYYYQYYGRLARGLAAFISKEGQKLLERNGLTPFQQHITVVNFTEDE